MSSAPSAITSPSTNAIKNRLAALDSLRFGAALMVVLYHYTAFHNGIPAESPFARFGLLARVAKFGFLGVQLFFFISGFVILMSAWGKSSANFASSRISRLYPAYWASVIFNTALVIAVPLASPRPSLSTILTNFSMFQEAAHVPSIDGAYWSLWPELRFYLWIGVLMALGITRNRVLAFTLLWPLAGVLAQTTGMHFFSVVFCDAWSPYFAAGMLLYLAYREGWSLVGGLLMAFNVALALAPVLSVAIGNSQGGGFPIRPGVAAALVPVLFLLVVAATMTPIAHWRAGVLTWLGLLTYPIYLVHRPIGLTVAKLLGMQNQWLYLTVSVVLAVLTALAIHYLVERPFGPPLRRWLRRELESMARRDADNIRLGDRHPDEGLSKLAPHHAVAEQRVPIERAAG